MSKTLKILAGLALLALIFVACAAPTLTPPAAPSASVIATPSALPPLPSTIPTVRPSPTATIPLITPIVPTADELWQRSQSCTCLVAYTQPENRGSIVLKAIASAQKSIRLKIYMFTRPDVQQALMDARKRGVDVRVLAELNTSGGGTQNVDTFNAMKNSGVKWRWASYDFRFTHEKSIVIDDKVGLIMTYNLTTTAFNSSRGFGVLNTRPDDVAEMIRVYEADWEKVTPDLSNARLVWSPVNARQKWLAFIDSANSTLELAQEEWLAPEIVAHVADAGKRGVRVRVVLPPSENREPYNQEPYYNQVRAVGGEVKFLDEPRMVGKITIVDGVRVFLGSENVSDNSLNNNRELGIIFDQPDAVATIKQAFEYDWLRANLVAFPTSDVQIPASGIVNWKDAAKYYNRQVTIEGQVVQIYNSGRVMFLQFSEDWKTDMKAVIFPSDWSKFPERPDKLFFGKTIRVTGRVQKYENAPEIIVNNPSQITVVK